MNKNPHPQFSKKPIQPASPNPGNWLTPEDLTGDIERLISRVVAPYIDESNPLMHADELQAECRAKLAAILDAGHLARCRTRAKAFAFIKTAFKNRIRTIVFAHVFTAKRGGRRPRPKGQKRTGSLQMENPTSVTVLRLDDDEAGVQIGTSDAGLRCMEFWDEVSGALTADERKLLVYLSPEMAKGEHGGLLIGVRRLAAMTESIREKCRRAVSFKA